MKLIIVVLFAIIQTLNCYSQTIECKLKVKDISFKNPINIEVYNRDTIAIYVSISLEKKTDSVEWLLYSRDVFVKPFSKLITINKVDKESIRNLSFKIQLPEFFEELENGNLVVISNNRVKKGIFRLQITYGYDYKELDKVWISTKFKIH